ncbi:hypothetical protein [Agromyces mangrovi Wang et al. 2018]|uniref:hypothetical protein n=1 Tax=Agromyces mangrovi TaxID=1858653 RepID=UPI0025738B95|nr:hypothetical protein [Agromyces mangrovi]BDZ63772.1 hypothetical protein GCM10025877_07100 [Agromyces mangrovi]
MSRIRIAALVAAIATSAIALTDALIRIFTGRDSVFAYGSALPVVETVGGIIHVACYALIVVVLFTVAAPGFRGRPWRNVVRWALAFVYGAMAVGLGASLFGLEITGVLELIVNIGFFGMLLFPFALGVTMLIQRDRSASAWLLTLTLPAVVLMFVLPAVAAHPGYAETLANLGLALLGFPAVRATSRAGRVASVTTA